VVVPAVVLVLLAGLTGCSPHAPQGTGSRTHSAPAAASTQPGAVGTGPSVGAGAAAPAPASAAWSAGSLDSIDQDLNDADGAISQSGTDVSSADAAGRQNDAP
jgi:hypothetical protein